jgi:hypothetical protein
MPVIVVSISDAGFDPHPDLGKLNNSSLSKIGSFRILQVNSK